MNRKLDAALDKILGEALRCRGHFIEIHAALSDGGRTRTPSESAAAAMATLSEIHCDELVRLCRELHEENRSVSAEAVRKGSL